MKQKKKKKKKKEKQTDSVLPCLQLDTVNSDIFV